MRDNRLNQSEEIEVNLMDWLSFFEPYELALQELKINLRGIRQQYKTKGLHSPIEFVDGRIKTISSILDKLDRMGLSIQEIDKVYDWVYRLKTYLHLTKNPAYDKLMLLDILYEGEAGKMYDNLYDSIFTNITCKDIEDFYNQRIEMLKNGNIPWKYETYLFNTRIIRTS